MAPPPPPPPPPSPSAAVQPTFVARRAPDRLDSIWNWSVLLVSIAVVVASMVLSPTTEAVSLLGVRIPELCTIRRLTGLSCPGCGLTRSFTFMGHGQILSALQMHWVGPLLYLGVVAQIPLRIRHLWRARTAR